MEPGQRITGGDDTGRTAVRQRVLETLGSDSRDTLIHPVFLRFLLSQDEHACENSDYLTLHAICCTQSSALRNSRTMDAWRLTRRFLLTTPAVSVSSVSSRDRRGIPLYVCVEHGWFVISADGRAALACEWPASR
jgi:hypothetical protein